jgi:hypothetical protein
VVDSVFRNLKLLDSNFPWFVKKLLPYWFGTFVIGFILEFVNEMICECRTNLHYNPFFHFRKENQSDFLVCWLQSTSLLLIWAVVLSAGQVYDTVSYFIVSWPKKSKLMNSSLKSSTSLERLCLYKFLFCANGLVIWSTYIIISFNFSISLWWIVQYYYLTNKLVILIEKLPPFQKPCKNPQGLSLK